MSTIVSKIMSLARRTTGVTSDAVPGLSIRQVSSMCCTLVQKGQLFKAVVHRRHVRYFAHRGLRDAFLEENKPVGPRHKAMPTREQLKAPWDKDAEPHYPENWTFTQCPGYTPRFQSLELPFLFPNNQRGRVVQEEQHA